jgi:hypothetical protein
LLLSNMETVAAIGSGRSELEAPVTTSISHPSTCCQSSRYKRARMCRFAHQRRRHALLSNHGEAEQATRPVDECSVELVVVVTCPEDGICLSDQRGTLIIPARQDVERHRPLSLRSVFSCAKRVSYFEGAHVYHQNLAATLGAVDCGFNQPINCAREGAANAVQSGTERCSRSAVR